MPATQSAMIMLVAGIGIPVLAALNAALGQRMGSPVAAGVILFLVALLTTGIVFLMAGGSLKAAVGAPPHLFLAGCLVAFYVLTITWVAPTFGVGNAVFFVLIGQLISAAIIDHFGLFGAAQHPLTLARAAGIAVMGAGVFLTQIAGRA
ncbi:DMT family transporter [Phaeobacter sp. QD34_3]|uniref:DMT family transporter n=1 Tax=unclassified Phaeobacter TaxID=2621772 RepID=UPI00237FA6E7|nr:MULTISPECIES: DMT family transporter [unclassified Phaeobacter]MDE4132623.1 DMT family transporter [Phaeobacter sp. QD34_3]MDE4136259.1 DMT family transporter [Phaeobacter sp. QD34_24]